MILLIVLIIYCFVCLILIAKGIEAQCEEEGRQHRRELYKIWTGHFPEEAEAVAKRQAQEFADILKRQDLWKIQLMLRVPDMYHFTEEEAHDFARRYVRHKGLTKEDCVRIGYPRLARFAET